MTLKSTSKNKKYVNNHIKWKKFQINYLKLYFWIIWAVDLVKINVSIDWSIVVNSKIIPITPKILLFLTNSSILVYL